MSNLAELVPNVVCKQVVVVGDTRLEAELVLVCAGLPPNKASIARLVAPHHRDRDGRVKVGPGISILCMTLYLSGQSVFCTRGGTSSICHRGLLQHPRAQAGGLCHEAGGDGGGEYHQGELGVFVPSNTVVTG